MTKPLRYAGHDIRGQAPDALLCAAIDAHHGDPAPWGPVLRRAWSGSAGIVSLVLLPRVGSSSSVVDRRPVAPTVTPQVTVRVRDVAALPIVGQMQELQAALSLNKSQLARILRVTRPTLYDWLDGREPNAANADRVNTLLRVLRRASVSSASPLNARFVARPVDIDAPSLIELLCEDSLHEDRLIRAIERSRELADSSTRRRTAREQRLRTLGFEELGVEQRRRQLATNVALRKWPERSSEAT